MSDEDILKKWETLPIEQRDELMVEVSKRGLFPAAIDDWEAEAGLYPDTEDPRFTQKLMRKLEFAENKQDSIEEQQKEGANPCDPDKEFELSPVQRFIGRFLSPQCPYQSALLYHGVGVGKTCAAITVAENYLRSYPRKQVIIVAPRNIQPGFRRTIFDDEALQIPEQEGVLNVAKGCTGNNYLNRTGMGLERDRVVVSRHITQTINSRYVFMGYIQFHRMIDDIVKRIPKDLDEDVFVEKRDRLLRREFSGRLVIIDEAHNLRDNPGESPDDDADNPGGDAEMTESQAGKKLTPSLIKVLNAAEGMKLLLMSGTPMYNSYREIIFLMNLLLMNDKKVTLSESDIFNRNGSFTKRGEQLLGSAANAYVSFMRGENPLSFPVRLPPEAKPIAWPVNSPDAKPIPEEHRARMSRLPFVPVKFEAESMKEYLNISQEAIESGGLSVGSIDEMVQSGNWLFPAESGFQIRDAGFDNCFQDSGGAQSQFTAKDTTWLLRENLGKASPKAKLTLDRIQTAKGLVFIYSRFIKSGALPMALALEANGYTAWGTKLLTNAVTDGLGRQCALCSKREKKHSGAGHKFIPAKYILITGRANISPNNTKAIQASRLKSNMDGREIKIIIGSQVASEGIDFRFVREIYVFDSWFHLNKMEQVLGRGIRTCSHALMAEEERNCTIHLLVNTTDEDTETADLYMYRNAMEKAIQVGKVTRVLKRYALDCNLNRDAIIVSGLKSQRHVDSQGNVREEVDINDTPFTNVCDWIETCDYECAVKVDINMNDLDITTYDDYAVRWRESELKTAIRKLFLQREQPVFQLAEILEQFSAIPPKAIAGLLSEIVGNESFRISMPVRKTGRTIEGYLVYRNGYYMFQPDYLADVRIPLALRVAEIPVKRDSFDPTKINLVLPGIANITESGAVAPSPSDQSFWDSIVAWAEAIGKGAAPLDDIPEGLQKAISERYSGDMEMRENDQLIMVNWLYEHIKKSEYPNKAAYLNALAKALLGMVWDESLKPNEQLELLLKGAGLDTATDAGQILEVEGKKAFQMVDVSTGAIKYYCGTTLCSEATARVFESKDPLRDSKANNATTGNIYGFIISKSKDGRLVFKSNARPVPPGTKPEKGGECAIISTISHHIKTLKEIAKLMEAEGYPKLILVDEYLDEKVMRRQQETEAKEKATAEGIKYEKKVLEQPIRKTEYSKKGKHAFKTRVFENTIRACGLMNIVLRWIDILQREKEGKRYFYRPIEAIKSGHKGTK